MRPFSDPSSSSSHTSYDGARLSPSLLYLLRTPPSKPVHLSPISTSSPVNTSLDHPHTRTTIKDATTCTSPFPPPDAEGEEIEDSTDVWRRIANHVVEQLLWQWIGKVYYHAYAASTREVPRRPTTVTSSKEEESICSKPEKEFVSHFPLPTSPLQKAVPPTNPSAGHALPPDSMSKENKRPQDKTSWTEKKATPREKGEAKEKVHPTSDPLPEKKKVEREEEVESLPSALASFFYPDPIEAVEDMEENDSTSGENTPPGRGKNSPFPLSGIFHTLPPLGSAPPASISLLARVLLHLSRLGPSLLPQWESLYQQAIRSPPLTLTTCHSSPLSDESPASCRPASFSHEEVLCSHSPCASCDGRPRVQWRSALLPLIPPSLWPSSSATSPAAVSSTSNARSTTTPHTTSSREDLHQKHSLPASKWNITPTPLSTSSPAVFVGQLLHVLPSPPSCGEGQARTGEALLSTSSASTTSSPMESTSCSPSTRAPLRICRNHQTIKKKPPSSSGTPEEPKEAMVAERFTPTHPTSEADASRKMNANPSPALLTSSLPRGGASSSSSTLIKGKRLRHAWYLGKRRRDSEEKKEEDKDEVQEPSHPLSPSNANSSTATSPSSLSYSPETLQSLNGEREERKGSSSSTSPCGVMQDALVSSSSPLAPRHWVLTYPAGRGDEMRAGVWDASRARRRFAAPPGVQWLPHLPTALLPILQFGWSGEGEDPAAFCALSSTSSSLVDSSLSSSGEPIPDRASPFPLRAMTATEETSVKTSWKNGTRKIETRGRKPKHPSTSRGATSVHGSSTSNTIVSPTTAVAGASLFAARGGGHPWWWWSSESGATPSPLGEVNVVDHHTAPPQTCCSSPHDVHHERVSFIDASTAPDTFEQVGGTQTPAVVDGSHGVSQTCTPFVPLKRSTDVALPPALPAVAPASPWSRWASPSWSLDVSSTLFSRFQDRDPALASGLTSGMEHTSTSFSTTIPHSSTLLAPLLMEAQRPHTTSLLPLCKGERNVTTTTTSSTEAWNTCSPPIFFSASHTSLLVASLLRNATRGPSPVQPSHGFSFGGGDSGFSLMTSEKEETYGGARVEVDPGLSSSLVGPPAPRTEVERTASAIPKPSGMDTKKDEEEIGNDTSPSKDEIAEAPNDPTEKEKNQVEEDTILSPTTPQKYPRKEAYHRVFFPSDDQMVVESEWEEEDHSNVPQEEKIITEEEETIEAIPPTRMEPTAPSSCAKKTQSDWGDPSTYSVLWLDLPEWGTAWGREKKKGGGEGGDENVGCSCCCPCEFCAPPSFSSCLPPSFQDGAGKRKRRCNDETQKKSGDDGAPTSDVPFVSLDSTHTRSPVSTLSLPLFMNATSAEKSEKDRVNHPLRVCTTEEKEKNGAKELHTHDHEPGHPRSPSTITCPTATSEKAAPMVHGTTSQKRAQDIEDAVFLSDYSFDVVVENSLIEILATQLLERVLWREGKVSVPRSGMSFLPGSTTAASSSSSLSSDPTRPIRGVSHKDPATKEERILNSSKETTTIVEPHTEKRKEMAIPEAKKAPRRTNKKKSPPSMSKDTHPSVEDSRKEKQEEDQKKMLEKETKKWGEKIAKELLHPPQVPLYPPRPPTPLTPPVECHSDMGADATSPCSCSCPYCWEKILFSKDVLTEAGIAERLQHFLLQYDALLQHGASIAWPCGEGGIRKRRRRTPDTAGHDDDEKKKKEVPVTSFSISSTHSSDNPHSGGMEKRNEGRKRRREGPPPSASHSENLRNHSEMEEEKNTEVSVPPVSFDSIESNVPSPPVPPPSSLLRTAESDGAWNTSLSSPLQETKTTTMQRGIFLFPDTAGTGVGKMATTAEAASLRSTSTMTSPSTTTVSSSFSSSFWVYSIFSTPAMCRYILHLLCHVVLPRLVPLLLRCAALTLGARLGPLLVEPSDLAETAPHQPYEYDVLCKYGNGKEVRTTNSMKEDHRGTKNESTAPGMRFPPACVSARSCFTLLSPSPRIKSDFQSLTSLLSNGGVEIHMEDVYGKALLLLHHLLPYHAPPPLSGSSNLAASVRPFCSSFLHRNEAITDGEALPHAVLHRSRKTPVKAKLREAVVEEEEEEASFVPLPSPLRVHPSMTIGMDELLTQIEERSRDLKQECTAPLSSILSPSSDRRASSSTSTSSHLLHVHFDDSFSHLKEQDEERFYRQEEMEACEDDRAFLQYLAGLPGVEEVQEGIQRVCQWYDASLLLHWRRQGEKEPQPPHGLSSRPPEVITPKKGSGCTKENTRSEESGIEKESRGEASSVEGRRPLSAMVDTSTLPTTTTALLPSSTTPSSLSPPSWLSPVWLFYCWAEGQWQGLCQRFAKTSFFTTLLKWEEELSLAHVKDTTESPAPENALALAFIESTPPNEEAKEEDESSSDGVEPARTTTRGALMVPRLCTSPGLPSFGWPSSFLTTTTTAIPPSPSPERWRQKIVWLELEPSDVATPASTSTPSTTPLPPLPLLASTTHNTDDTAGMKPVPLSPSPPTELQSKRDLPFIPSEAEEVESSGLVPFLTVRNSRVKATHEHFSEVLPRPSLLRGARVPVTTFGTVFPPDPHQKTKKRKGNAETEYEEDEAEDTEEKGQGAPPFLSSSFSPTTDGGGVKRKAKDEVAHAENKKKETTDEEETGSTLRSNEEEEEEEDAVTWEEISGVLSSLTTVFSSRTIVDESAWGYDRNHISLPGISYIGITSPSLSAWNDTTEEEELKTSSEAPRSPLGFPRVTFEKDDVTLDGKRLCERPLEQKHEAMKEKERVEDIVVKGIFYHEKGLLYSTSNDTEEAGDGKRQDGKVFAMEVFEEPTITLPFSSPM